MTGDHSRWFLVSADPDRFIWPDFNRDHMLTDEIDPPHYQTEKDAIDAIKAGVHGEIGRLYVLQADLTVAATATRGWTLIKGEQP